MIQAKPTIIELDMSELEDALRRAAERLDEKDFGLIKAVIESYAYLTELVGDKDTTIRRLRQMLFGVKTEKTSTVVGGLKDAEPVGGVASPETTAVPESPAATDAQPQAQADAGVPAEVPGESDAQASDERNGHGRNGADDFRGAQQIEVRHESLQPGDPCPECGDGTLYDTGRPGVLVRLVGQAPVAAVVYHLQKLRCNPCGALFTARLPEDVDPEEKYDATVGSMIALFLSGRQHAGENLKDVLRRRATQRPPPIQMCDALARNLPGELKTIVANCLAHGRRRFVDEADRFPDECRHVLEMLAVVYHNDAIARERKLSPEERLLFHQSESGPTMEELHVWLVQQFDQRRVEPNSALGKAIWYLLRHWEKLTLFLRMAGAPLDNNVCERALKKSIRHRRNSLFYKTLHGAHVGDIFMGLIATCELCGANPFDYLTELDRHAGEAGVAPHNWMPWNYRETLEGMRDGQTPPEESRQED